MIRTAILAVAALIALSLNAEAMRAVYLLIADADGQGARNQHWAYCLYRCLREGTESQSAIQQRGMACDEHTQQQA